MKARDFIEEIKRLELGTFNYNDALKILNKDRKYTSLYLSRLIKTGSINRISRSRFAIPDIPIEIVASNLVFPSYISFLSGLSIHKLTTQITKSIQIVTTKSIKPLSYGDIDFQFTKMKPKRVFGYKKIISNLGSYFIGKVEKIIVDSLYLPQKCPIPETFFAIKNYRINKKLLSDYLLNMNSKITIKRCGYLLDLAGYQVPSNLMNNTSRKYELLNPSLPKRGEKNSVWHLIINEELRND